MTVHIKKEEQRSRNKKREKTAGMESRFDFYSFSVYEFLISIITFLLVKMFILDIRN